MKMSARNCIEGKIIDIKEGHVACEVTIASPAGEKVIFSIMADNMELFKQYTDNQDFKKWLSDLVFNLTYNKNGKPYQPQK